MLTRLRQYRIHGLVTAILVGIAGAIVVLLLPARQEAVARVQLLSASPGDAPAEPLAPADTLALLDDDALINKVLQRIEPDIVDSIDPRPVDPVIAFRRNFHVSLSADGRSCEVAYAARSADKARRVIQTWLQVAGESIPAAAITRPRATSSALESPEDKPSPADPAQTAASDRRDHERSIVRLQQQLAQAQAALSEYDLEAARTAQAAGKAEAEAAQRQRRQRIGSLRSELDAAIAENGALEARLAATPQTLTQTIERAADAGVRPPQVDPQLQARLQEAEAALAGLRVRFTDSHPDVRRQMAVVAQARADLDEAIASDAGAAPAPPVVAQQEVANPEWRVLDRQVNRSRRTVANLRVQLAQASAGENAAVTPPASAVAERDADSDARRIALVAALDEAKAELNDAASRAPGHRATSPAEGSRTDALVDRAQADDEPDPGIRSGRPVSVTADASAARAMPVSLRVLEQPRVRAAGSNPDRAVWLQRVMLASLAIGALTMVVLALRRNTWHDARALEHTTGLRALGEIPRFVSWPRRLRGLLRWLGFLLLAGLYVLAFLVVIRISDKEVPLRELASVHVREAVAGLLESARQGVGSVVGEWQRPGESR